MEIRIIQQQAYRAVVIEAVLVVVALDRCRHAVTTAIRLAQLHGHNNVVRGMHERIHGAAEVPKQMAPRTWVAAIALEPTGANHQI